MDKQEKRDYLRRIKAGYYGITHPWQNSALLRIVLKCKSEIEKNGLTKEDFCNNEELRQHTLVMKDLKLRNIDTPAFVKKISFTKEYIFKQNVGIYWRHTFCDVYANPDGESVNVCISKDSMKKIYHIAVEPMDDEIEDYEEKHPKSIAHENVTNGMRYCMEFLSPKQKDFLMILWSYYRRCPQNPIYVPEYYLSKFDEIDMAIKFMTKTQDDEYIIRYLISDIITEGGFVKFYFNNNALKEIFFALPENQRQKGTLPIK